jgi:putative ABC transport system permease protein
MDTLLQDLKYAARTLRRARGFTAIAILTLALGIGGTTAIYSVVDAVLLQPLPFPDAERIVVPRSVNMRTGDQWSIAYADFVDWRNGKVFEHVAAYGTSEMDLAGDASPTRVNVTSVSDQYFGALGIGASVGRLLQPADYALERDPVVVISGELWKDHFSGDSAVIGRTIRLNGLLRTIVGVLPEGMRWPGDSDVWAPLRISNPTGEDVTRRDNFVYVGIARLAPGQTLESTRTRLAAMAKIVETEHPVMRKDVSITAITAVEALLGDTLPRILWLLLGAIAMVLLIGCVNIANLMLARAGTRHRELAVRTALGASRGRLIRQILTESALLAAAGGVLGALLAIWCVRALVSAAPAEVPRIEEVEVSYAVLAIALALSVACAFLFGLIPALQASATRPGQALGEGSQRLAGGRRANRGRSALVVMELALALMLLAGAGLLTHSLIKLQNTNPGFETARVVTVSVALPTSAGTRYQARQARRDFYSRALDRLTAMPGVESASMSSALPLGGGGFYLGRAFLAEGWAEPPASTEVTGSWNIVAPRFFETLRLPVIRGRDFTARDDTTSTPVMIINESFAKAMFPGQDPIGKRVQSWRDERVLREVVGVVADVRYFDLEDANHALAYVPYAQDSWGRMRFVIRTAGDPTTVVAAARREIATLDPDIALALVSTMDDAMRDALAAPRFTTFLLSGFAGMALLLVAIGLYGVLSYSIAQRTHEIGIRMALGARSSTVLGMVVREAALLVALGIIVGAVGAAGVSKVIASILYEVKPTDPATFVAVILILAVVGVAAAWMPARRATRVDPLIALRSAD